MLRYNTQLKRLTMPEYGRNIQSMVDHCLTIDDRDERTRCAYSIVEAMAKLFPELKAGGCYDHKLWDHLAIMSDFRLDIDYPCEIIAQDNLASKPDSLKYSPKDPFRRHYGRAIQALIEEAVKMDEADEQRSQLVNLIANQMKKQLLASNRDGVDDERIVRDLVEMSGGRIAVDSSTLRLCDYIIPKQPVAGKKKRKR